jgi:hypothetical protein
MVEVTSGAPDALDLNRPDAFLHQDGGQRQRRSMFQRPGVKIDRLESFERDIGRGLFPFGKTTAG